MPSPAPTAPAVGFEHRLADAIARRISEPRYNLWFREHTRFVPVGDGVVVGVPNLYFHDWLQKTFGADVRAAAAEVLGGPAAVRFAIDPELFQVCDVRLISISDRRCHLRRDRHRLHNTATDRRSGLRIAR